MSGLSTSRTAVIGLRRSSQRLLLMPFSPFCRRLAKRGSRVVSIAIPQVMPRDCAISRFDQLKCVARSLGAQPGTVVLGSLTQDRTKTLFRTRRLGYHDVGDIDGHLGLTVRVRDDQNLRTCGNATSYSSKCFATNVPFGWWKISSSTIAPSPRNSTTNPSNLTIRNFRPC